MSLEFARAELELEAFQRTMMQSCTITIVGQQLFATASPKFLSWNHRKAV